jgi:hypothetical protein
MKRYLLIGVGYNQLAIPYDTSERLATLVAALADARTVESKGYGDEQRFIPTTVEPLQMQFIEASKVTIGDDLATLRAQLEDLSKEQAKYSKYWTDERAKSARLEKELKELKAPAPAPPTSEPVVQRNEESADDLQF